MAKYRVQSVEERPDAQVKCDTYVLTEKPDPGNGTMDVVIGHFDVILSAAAVLAASELPQAERVAVYKLLFSADPRIEGVIDSEAAVAQMEADVSFPVTVTL